MSLIFIALDLIYGAYYRQIKTTVYFDYNHYISFDLWGVIVWDTLMLSSDIFNRVWSIAKLSQLHKLFIDIVSVLEYCVQNEIATCQEILCKIKGINIFARRWVIYFFAIGSLHCTMYLSLYILGLESKRREGFLFGFMNTYMEFMIALHNSNALLIIFFIQLITLGFELVINKLLTCTIPSAALFENFMHKSSSLKLGQKSLVGNAPTTTSGTLHAIFEIVKRIEKMIEDFQRVFAPALFLETTSTLYQAIFSAYYMRTDPRIEQNIIWALTFFTPLVIYPVCLISLCYFSNQLTKKCFEMVAALEEIPFSYLSIDDDRRVGIAL